jgi:hypothetical protein
LWSASSQAVWAPASGCTGALLVSPFNVKWGCYAWGGSVEESKFCLFSVVFPVMCISSFSPRFYFRNHAFCFLPLAAILESSPKCFFSECSHYWYALICNFLSMERGGLPSHRVPCAGDLKLCLGSTSQGGTYLTLSAPGCSPPFSCLPQHLTGFQPIWFLLYSS